MTVELVAAALVAAILIVWPANALLGYRKQRRWDRHVDAALVLGGRRPQDALDERWPT